MHIAVLAETRDGESRVAATPDSVKALIKQNEELMDNNKKLFWCCGADDPLFPMTK